MLVILCGAFLKVAAMGRIFLWKMFLFVCFNNQEQGKTHGELAMLQHGRAFYKTETR